MKPKFIICDIKNNSYLSTSGVFVPKLSDYSTAELFTKKHFAQTRITDLYNWSTVNGSLTDAILEIKELYLF